MNVSELKQLVEAARASLKDKSGHICKISETGPVGIGLIDALVQVIEAQQRRIDELEKLIHGTRAMMNTAM